MDNFKKLHAKIVSILSTKESLIALLIFFIYFSARPVTSAILLFSFIIVFFSTKLLSRYPSSKKSFVVIALTLLILLAIYSFLYNRNNSWDGQLWYIRHVLLLSDHFILRITSLAHVPYFVELLLAIINKFLGFEFVTFSFYVIALCNVFLLLQLFTLLKYKNHRNLLTFFIISTPVFLATALFEFKVEQFLLFFSLLSLIFYLRFEQINTYINSILFGFFASLAILSKIVVFPFFFMLGFLLLIKLSLQKRYNSLIQLLVGFFIMLLPLVIWVLAYGIKIPFTSLAYYPQWLQPTVTFEKNNEIFNKCVAEQKNIDYGQFILDRNWTDLLLQPIHYLFKYGVLDLSINGFGFIDPGLFVYLSFFVFIPAVLFNSNLRSSPLYLAAATYIAFYFIFIRTIYWYLFFLYPILLVPLFDHLYVKQKLNMFFKQLLLCLSVAYVFMAVGFALYLLDNFSILRSQALQSNIKLSNYLNGTTGLIMDATAFPEQAMLTFLHDYDSRVIRDSLYFGYTTKQLSDMYIELKNNNIKYVLVNPITEVPNLTFFGCPLRHKQIANKFVDLYATPIYYLNGTAMVFELK